MTRRLAAALCAVALALPGGAVAEPPRRTLAECMAIAVQGSGQVREAEGKVDEWRARLAEVKSVFYPKIQAFAFAAPVFGVTGTAQQPDVQRQWGTWGPYLRFEGMAVEPVYTFGQYSAGEKAARERLAVEEAKLDQTRNEVALEVARYYHLRQYVASMRPALESARKTLDSALQSAQETYDEASGKVTQADLQKLRYASAQLDTYRVQADIGYELALSALKHTMGRPDSEPLELAQPTLPPAPDEEIPPLAELVQRAWDHRPEVLQLKHGREAARSFEEAERAANYPVVALVAQLVASWTAVRTEQANTFAYDPFNALTGDVALAVKFDLDPAKASARGDAARSLVTQLDGLAKFAATGIPLEVRKARDDWDQARRLLAVSDQGATAARKWLIFSAAAYASGTGESKEVLEGLAAFVQARKGYYDNLLALHMAKAQMGVATGEILPPAAPGVR